MSQNEKRFLDQKGFSMIQVMVMSGVMVAMMMAFMSLMNHESKSVAYLEDKLSRIALEDELRLQFANPDYCTNLFKDVVAPAKAQTRNISSVLTKPLQQTSLLKVFTKRGNSTFYDKLKIKNIRLENSELTAPHSSGLVDVTFYPERTRIGGGPPSLQPIHIKTNVNVGAGYKIESCGAEAEDDGKGCRLGDFLKHVPKTQHREGCEQMVTNQSGIPQCWRRYSFTMNLKKVSLSSQNKKYTLLPSNSGTNDLKIPSQQMVWGDAFYSAGRQVVSGDTTLPLLAQCQNGVWAVKN